MSDDRNNRVSTPDGPHDWKSTLVFWLFITAIITICVSGCLVGLYVTNTGR